jgi:hypothetical protein
MTELLKYKELPLGFETYPLVAIAHASGRIDADGLIRGNRFLTEQGIFACDR